MLILSPPADSPIPTTNIDDFVIPESWLTDTGLPESGVLSLQYFSGKGIVNIIVFC